MALDYSPVLKAVAVTPNDTVDLTDGPCRGIYVGSAGNLRIITEHGSDITLVNIANGVVHPISARRVFSSGTTCTNIVAMY